MEFTVNWTGNFAHSLQKLYPEKPTGPINSLEIGAFEGKGSLMIIDHLCFHPESKVYCIDPWDDEYVKTDTRLSDFDFYFKGQYERFMNNTKSTDKIIPIKGTSDSVLPGLEPIFDFAYIDGDHSPEQVYKDACNVLLKMKQNAIILFDDYKFEHKGIKTREGIDKFLSENKERVSVLFREYQLAVRVNAS